ncbi:MAG: hypothetical protein ABFC96_18640 [Thermoguttaceae bacterium]
METRAISSIIASLALSAIAVVCLAVSVAADELKKPAASDQKAAAAAPSEPSAKESDKTAKIDKLIRRLGDKDYRARQRAQDELARQGFDAFEPIVAATTDPDPEIASRAKYLLRLMRMEWTAENDPPEVKHQLRDYESLDARTRESRMQVLAALPKGQGLAALCRLVRFEKSSQLSRMAAVSLLVQDRESPPDAATIETIRKTLAGCKRPAAQWLLCWTRLGPDADGTLTQWSTLLDAERDVLSGTPDDTKPEIVAAMTRCQVAWLKKLGRTEQAMTAIRRLVELENGNSETLGELLHWLIEQKAWKSVDALAGKFSSRFATEPGLLYLLAEAYALQGKKDRAEDTASCALRINAGKSEQLLMQHLQAAEMLAVRGQFAWARREFDHVISHSGPDPSQLTVEAWVRLAAMLHDQGQDLDAANTQEKLVRAIDAGKLTENELQVFKPKELRSQFHYYSACHWHTQKNLARERECLDKALKVNPEDIDVLIACYRLPDQSAEYHAKVVELIKNMAVSLHEQIADDPQSSDGYNNYAWLIGNTEGDLDEALRNAQKAVELDPERGGYYDTLAHVYAGKGDYKTAARHEAKAAKLDPHSGLIRQTLDDYRKKSEESKK